VRAIALAGTHRPHPPRCVIERRDVEALLEGLEPKTPEALLVDRSGLIEALRRSLGELHEYRRSIAGTPAEPETVHQIKYWDEVLGWVKELQGRDLMLFSRARP
jgi:hypothetical protein